MTNDRPHRHRGRPADAHRAAGERTRAQAGPGGHRGVVVQIGLSSEQGVDVDGRLWTDRRPRQHDRTIADPGRRCHRRRRVNDRDKRQARNRAGEPLGDDQPGVVVADTDDHAVDPALAPPGGDRIGATDDRNAQHGAGRCTTRRPGCAVIDDGDHLEGRTRLGRIDDAGCVARTPDDHHPTHPPTVEHVVRVRPHVQKCPTPSVR